MSKKIVLTAAGYDLLAQEFANAFLQASAGKGKERHANSKSFDRQPILEISRVVGPAFNTGQAMKKLGEATQMFQRGEIDRAIHEIYGAMVYCAAAVLRMKEDQA